MAATPQQAIVYGRISDDREGRALGIERQIQDGLELFDQLGWKLNEKITATVNGRVYPGVIADNDIGASSKSHKPRPGFAELLRLVRTGEVDGIGYYTNSRLTRRPAEYEQVIKLVEDTGVQLAAVKSVLVDLTTASGRMIGRVLAAKDAMEAEEISERVQREQQQRRAAGRAHPTGTRPFGWLAADKSIRRPVGTVADPTEAQAIRDAAKLILDGASLQDIINAWNEAGIKPVTGGRWSRKTVRCALTRPRVAGLIEHKGVILTGDDGEPIMGQHDPILSVEVWTDVCAKISDRASLVRARYHGREHLLSGFVFCGECGGRMKVSARRDEDGSVRADSFVSCVKQLGGCGRVKRNLRLTEAFVLPAVERWLEHIGDGYEPDDDDPAARELARLHARRDDLEARIGELRRAYTSTELDAVDFIPMINSLRAKVHELDDEIAAHGHDLRPRNSALPEDPVTAWATGEFDEKRAILEAVVDKIIMKPIGKVGPARSRALVPSTTEIVWR